MSETKLLPCPFCGGEAKVYFDEEGKADSQGRKWAYTTVCGKCASSSGLTYSRENVIRAWNTRKPMNDIVEQIREESDVVKNRYGIEFEGIAMDAAIDIVRNSGKE